MKKFATAIAILLAAVMPTEAADIITCSEKVQNGMWVCFRKTFELAEAPSENTLRISADSKYQLYVNGEIVVREGQLKRGPNPHDSYIDSLGIKNLRKGKNTVAVLVWYFGKGGYSHRSSSHAGLYFDLSGKAFRVSSDSSWKSRLHPAYYIPTGQKPNARLAESNIGYDARQELQSFADTLYNDSAWANAVQMNADSAGWGAFRSRPIPFFWHGEVKDYVSFHQTGNKIYCYLPYNAQVTPVLHIKANAAGKTIGIQSDCYPKSGTDYVMRYEYKTKTGEQEYEFPAWINGHVIIYTVPEGVEVIRLAYRETGYDCSLDGSFDSSDETLNKLWRKAQRTLYVTMRDNFMDCPDRERAQYIGDVTNELAEVPYAMSLSASQLIRKCAREFADWQKKDSVLYAPVPSGEWNKELPQQSLSFCGLGLWDYYCYYGDLQTMEYVYPAVKKYLHLWKVQQDSLVNYRSGSWDWGDWGTNVDLKTLNQTWYSVTLGYFSKMARLNGDDNESAWADTVRRNLNSAIFSKYWRGKAFNSSKVSKNDDRAQALAVLAGAAPPHVWDDVRKVFAQTEYASPYMERFVLQALCEMNNTQDALNRMRRRYRVMADSVYTTLWERFEPAPNSTYNHAWSGAPLIILSRYVCGITPLQPLFKEFQVKPQLCDLDYIRTAVPTPGGRISLYVSKKDGYRMQLDVPKGSNARVLLPSDYLGYHLNGKEIKLKLSEDTAFYELNLSHGYYVVEALINEADTVGAGARLANAMARLRYLRGNVSAGNGVGNAPAAYVSRFAAEADSLMASVEPGNDVYETVFRLREAENLCRALCDSLFLPSPGKWYEISAVSTGALLETDNVQRSRFPLGGVWIAGNAEEGHLFGMYNAASGDVFSEFPMGVFPAKDGKVALTDDSGGKYLRVLPEGFSEWTETGIDSLARHEFSFSFDAVEKPTLCFRDTMDGGAWKAVILPTRIDSVDGAGVSLYTVCGLMKDASGKLVGIKVNRLMRDSIFLSAGQPVIYHVDSAAGKTAEVSFYVQPHTPLSFPGKRSNGLVGVSDTTVVKQSGMLAFVNGVLCKADAPFTVMPRDCYINPKYVSELPTGADEIIFLGGSDTPDAVSPVCLSHKKEYVDVYTLDGLRVKRNVKRSKLSSTLRKGIYIIDGKKRVIK